MRVGRDAALRWWDDGCYRWAASLAYYSLFSIFPLVLLCITAIGYVLGSGPAVREQVLQRVTGGSAPEVRGLLDGTLQSMQAHRAARGPGAIAGAIALLLGASGGFSELEASLNAVWRVKPGAARNLWSTMFAAAKAKAISVAVVFCAGAAILASIVLSAVLGAIGRAATDAVGVALVWQVLETAGSAALLTLVLAAVYRTVPQTKVDWRDVGCAAFLTAMVVTGLKHLLAWSLVHLAAFAAYGVVGAVLDMLTWIYLVGLSVLYGAEFSRVYAERLGSLARGGDDRDDMTTAPQPRQFTTG
ncbi:MAG: YihY/virulence factor BrkB family protein [Polyangiaceae bacterium]